MPIPKPVVPTYKLTLPSNGKKIEYRPFLVKEQKILLMAQEAESNDQVLVAVQKITADCTFNQIDISKLPIFDLEYLFINLRAKSAGENVIVASKCPKCEHHNHIKVDLSKIKIENKPDTKIALTADMGIVFRYPTVEMLTQMTEKKVDVDSPSSFFEMINYCVESIYSKDEISTAGKDFTDKELTDFIENLNQEQFTKIQTFFDSMPTIRHKETISCKNCLHSYDMEMEGIQDFFE